MTNRERLNSMPDAEFIAEMEKYAACPGRRYLDMVAWLQAEDEEYVFDGIPGILTNPDGSSDRCVIVDVTDRFGTPYVTLMMKRPESDWQIISAPKEHVSAITEEK